MQILKTFQKTVTTAGTQEPLTASVVNALRAVIKAHTDNTGSVFVGDANVDSTNGYVLEPDEELVIEMEHIGGNVQFFDLSAIYVDTETNGNKVCVAYTTRVY